MASTLVLKEYLFFLSLLRVIFQAFQIWRWGISEPGAHLHGYETILVKGNIFLKPRSEVTYSQDGSLKYMEQIFQPSSWIDFHQISHVGSLSVHSSEKSIAKIFWTPVLEQLSWVTDKRQLLILAHFGLAQLLTLFTTCGGG